MLFGMAIKDLSTFTDERGMFRELIRVTDDFFSEGFQQWSHTITYFGVVKAWHLHKVQTDWWYVPTGAIKAAFYDTRPESPTHGELVEMLMDEMYGPKIVKIPPGVAHGYRVIQSPMHLFYVTSRVYDPQDELRIPHDDPTIGYDWLAGPKIK